MSVVTSAHLTPCHLLLTVISRPDLPNHDAASTALLAVEEAFIAIGDSLASVGTYAVTTASNLFEAALSRLRDAIANATQILIHIVGHVPSYYT